MVEYGLSVTSLYSNINDFKLDVLVLQIKNEFPNCGYRMMNGHF